MNAGEMHVDLREIIRRLAGGEHMDRAGARAVLGTILSGKATQAQIGALLMGMHLRGESIDEITGFAEAMRAHAVPFDPRPGAVDLCGTGGDAAGTINISTAAALVTAACGVPVAKHGNRAASSQCGSADVLEALGVEIDLTPDQVAACIDEIGFGFLFAPRFHPAMKHAIGPRRELGQRTIFNVLGPLTNPAGATHQLIGVYDPALTLPLAEVLQALGGEAAFVVHGHGSLDELTTDGPNRLSHLRDGRVRTFEMDAADLGLRPATLDQLRGGDPARNAGILRAVLAGEDQSPRRDVVLLNAAAALATEDGDFERALTRAMAAGQNSPPGGSNLPPQVRRNTSWVTSMAMSQRKPSQCPAAASRMSDMARRVSR